MKPEKALEIVKEYSLLTRSVKALTQVISDNLSNCNGISGKRQEKMLNAEYIERDSKNREPDLHLTSWYKGKLVPGDGGYPEMEYQEIDKEHEKECKHCYDAHVAIQARKAARKRLGVVKGVMSRVWC